MKPRKDDDSTKKGFFARLFSFENPTVSVLSDFDLNDPEKNTSTPLRTDAASLTNKYQQLAEVDYYYRTGKGKKPSKEALQELQTAFRGLVINNKGYDHKIIIQLGASHIYVEKENHGKSVNEALGWKIHIAIDKGNHENTASEDKENCARGTDIVADILKKYNVSVFKFEGSYGNSPWDFRRGKHITIYYELDKEKDWPKILLEIETALRENNIRPAAKSSMDEYIGESKFITYRYDLDKQGRYINAAKAKSFNEAGVDDPFKDYLKGLKHTIMQSP